VETRPVERRTLSRTFDRRSQTSAGAGTETFVSFLAELTTTDSPSERRCLEALHADGAIFAEEAEMDGGSLTEILTQLREDYAQVRRAGDALRRAPHPSAVRRYREYVRRFLARAVAAVQIEEDRFPGRTGWLNVRILRRAKEAYEALARWEVEEEDLRRLLTLTGELEGLLFDLLL